MSQGLVGLWADEYGPALALLRCIFPPGLMRYLSVPRASPIQSAPSLAQVSALVNDACWDLIRSQVHRAGTG